ncbi:hypothetical protein BsIDN1_13910 [Bacillus safensis]|uniref:Uncharacterized protein n=1 Tax=Bacillus safensis TaxID=561879 RepID=A0A5S9M3Q5_BACIA|nr:hypothetical protein BsIDN1_13910 [Bacillus safensis]
MKIMENQKIVEISQKTIREIIIVSFYFDLKLNKKNLCNLVDKFLSSIGLSCIFCVEISVLRSKTTKNTCIFN